MRFFDETFRCVDDSTVKKALRKQDLKWHKALKINAICLLPTLILPTQ